MLQIPQYRRYKQCYNWSKKRREKKYKTIGGIILNMNIYLSRLVNTINKSYKIDSWNVMFIDIRCVDFMLNNGFDEKKYYKILDKYDEEINYLSLFSYYGDQLSINISNYNRLLNLKFTLVIIAIKRYVKEVSVEQLKLLLNENSNKQIEIIEFIASTIEKSKNNYNN